MGQSNPCKWIDQTITTAGSVTLDPTMVDPGVTLNVRLNGTGLIATYTVVLPSGATVLDGQFIKLIPNVAITALTLTASNAIAVQRALSGLILGGSLILQYAADTAKWYQVN